LEETGSTREQGDAFLQGAPKVELLAPSCAEGDGQFGEFGLEGFVALQGRWHVPLEHVPDLHEQFARDGGHGDVALAFAQKKLPAPLAQGCFLAGAQDGLCSLDEPVADVATASSAYAETDVFALSAAALPGVEPDVGDEIFGAGEALDVSDDRHQGKGADQAEADAAAVEVGFQRVARGGRCLSLQWFRRS
jgi:hypothetical protein